MKTKKYKIYRSSFLSNLGSHSEQSGFKGLFYKIKNRHTLIDEEIETVKEGVMDKEKQAHYRKLSKMKLGGSDYLVFLCLLGHIDYYNRITIQQKDIAELCGMSRPQVSRSIKKLKEVGVLENTKELIIHFDLLFRGPSEEYEKQKQILMMQAKPFNKLGRADDWGNADEGLKQKERDKAKEELTEE